MARQADAAGVSAFGDTAVGRIGEEGPIWGRGEEGAGGPFDREEPCGFDLDVGEEGGQGGGRGGAAAEEQGRKGRQHALLHIAARL